MKAYVKLDSTLVIYPENATESYALEVWKNKNLVSLDVCIDLEILDTYEAEKLGLYEEK